VREVLVDDEKQEATVIVPDDQLSLAIGREGQNARLAAKLTGWKVDIKSETEFSQEEEDIEYEDGEDVDGRCAAVLSAGRRCPNASLAGSRYCGLPQHQALARFDTNQVTVLSALSDDEIQKLADANADESEIRPLVERATAQLEQDGAGDEAEAEGEAASPEEALAQDAAAEGDEDAAESDAEEAGAEPEEAPDEAEEAAVESAEADEPEETSDEAKDAEVEKEAGAEPEEALAEDA